MKLGRVLTNKYLQKSNSNKMVGRELFLAAEEEEYTYIILLLTSFLLLRP